MTKASAANDSESSAPQQLERQTRQHRSSCEAGVNGDLRVLVGAGPPDRDFLPREKQHFVPNQCSRMGGNPASATNAVKVAVILAG
jgi:hypothetical protein